MLQSNGSKPLQTTSKTEADLSPEKPATKGLKLSSYVEAFSQAVGTKDGFGLDTDTLRRLSKGQAAAKAALGEGHDSDIDNMDSSSDPSVGDEARSIGGQSHHDEEFSPRMGYMKYTNKGPPAALN